MFYTLLAAALSAADISLKEKAEKLPNMTKVHNKWRTLIPLVFTGGILGVFIYLNSCRPESKKDAEKLERHKAAAAYILAGGISNVSDKLRKGYVVDYLNIPKGPLKRIYFNLADVYILIGSLFLW